MGSGVKSGDKGGEAEGAMARQEVWRVVRLYATFSSPACTVSGNPLLLWEIQAIG